MTLAIRETGVQRTLYPALKEIDTIRSISSESLLQEAFLQAEFSAISQEMIKRLDLADRLVRQGILYRGYKKDRTLARRNLMRKKRRLSCSEFIWYLLSLSGLDMGEQPVNSKKMAFRKKVYVNALKKVSGDRIQIGDILAYSHSREELKRQRALFGKSQVGHVVMVVSVKEHIVVGSHGTESTPYGEPIGVGYRQLLQGWDSWTHERSLQAVYRIASNQGGSE